MDNIQFNSFQNMCRTCLYTSDLIYIPDTCITDVLDFVTRSKYSKTDQLPQQLCLKCIETMKQIQTFAFRCKQIHLSLMKCLNEFKDKQNSKETTTSEDTNFVEIKQETYELELITEHLVKDELLFEQMIGKDEFTVEKTPETIETTTDCFETIAKPKTIAKSKTIAKPKTIARPTATNLINNSNTKPDDDYKCNVCGEDFKYFFRLVQHKRIHENFHKCDVCNEVFSDKSVLIKHFRTHSERPYNCVVCLKKFRKSHHLIEHKRLHNNPRLNTCDICKKSFAKKSILLSHKAAHSDQRRFECGICLKSFKYSRNLITHKKKHDELSYNCDECSKTFYLEENLIRHKSTHSLFKCEDCDKIFQLKDDLVSHEATHLFECDECLKSFKQFASLIDHKKIHVLP